MGNTTKSVHLIDTDPVEWTPECERLLTKLNERPADQALQSIRSLLAAELEQKRGMLGGNRVGGSAGDEMLR